MLLTAGASTRMHLQNPPHPSQNKLKPTSAQVCATYAQVLNLDRLKWEYSDGSTILEALKLNIKSGRLTEVEVMFLQITLDLLYISAEDQTDRQTDRQVGVGVG